MSEVKRGVSHRARNEVFLRAHKFCELFHDEPVLGDQIAHTTHQGAGGAAEEAECNDPNVLLWSCSECHARLHGPGMPWRVVEIDLDEGILEIIDDQGRKVPHEDIFFHQRQPWFDAMERYPELTDAVRRRNEAAFDVAKHLAFFKPKKKGPTLYKICTEIQQMKGSDFGTFVSLLGMTASTAKELMPIGKWLNSEDMSSVRGIDIDALDALRQAPEEEVERLMGLTAKPVEFWEAVDAVTSKKHGRRAHYLQVTPEGEIVDIGLHAAAPDVAEAFGLLKGHIVKRNERVRGGEDVHEEESNRTGS